MLPLHVLKQSGVQSSLLVELKSGDTYQGVLVAADTFMNISLKDVIVTSGDKFHKCEEAFIRGNNIKAIQFQQEVLDKHQVVVK